MLFFSSISVNLLLLSSLAKLFKKLFNSILVLSSNVRAWLTSLLFINSLIFSIVLMTSLIGSILIFMLPLANISIISSTAFCSSLSWFFAFSRSSFDNFSVSKYLESISINSLFSSFNLFSFEFASITIPFSLSISSSIVFRDFLKFSISSCVLTFSSSRLCNSKFNRCILERFSIFFSLNGETLSVSVLIKLSN